MLEVLIVVALLLVSPASSINDSPQVECLEDAMRLHFIPDTITTNSSDANPKFCGHVYVKGFFFSSRCHLDFTRISVDQPFYFHIPYRSDCQVKRERLSNQSLANGEIVGSGFLYSTVIVVQHHRLFVTERDRAYSVTCFYHEDRNYFQNSLQIGDLTPSQVEGVDQLPSCAYEILSATTGRPARFANIGDLLIHRWTCDADNMGMLVHSCFVRDNIGSEFALLDERGCVTDESLMESLMYTEGLNETQSPPMSAFKFADQMTAYFTCRITLCDLRENGCEGITPPTCNLQSPMPGVPTDSSPQLLGGRRGPLGRESAVTADPSLSRTFATTHNLESGVGTEQPWPNSEDVRRWRNGVESESRGGFATTPAYALQLRPSTSAALGSVSDEWAQDGGINLFARGRYSPRHKNNTTHRRRRDAPTYFARTTTVRRELDALRAPEAKAPNASTVTTTPARLTIDVSADRLIIFTNDEKFPSEARADGGALHGEQQSTHNCGDITVLWMSAIFAMLLAATVGTFVGMHMRYRREMIQLRRQVQLQQRSSVAATARAGPPSYAGGGAGFAPPPFFELATMAERSAPDHMTSRQNLVS